MPQTGAEKDKQDIEAGSHSSTTAAAEGNVQIIGEP